MDSKKHGTTDSASDSKEVTDHSGEPVIESVARGIGTAIGVVASTAAKVMGKSESPEPEAKAPETKSHETKSPEIKSPEIKSPETKSKEKPRKSSKPRAAANENATKLSASRIAKKKKKRAAHRIKLRRSNTKG